MSKEHPLPPGMPTAAYDFVPCFTNRLGVLPGPQLGWTFAIRAAESGTSRVFHPGEPAVQYVPVSLGGQVFGLEGGGGMYDERSGAEAMLGRMYRDRAKFGFREWTFQPWSPR